MTTDITTQILIEIRDNIKATNERLDGTNQRLGSLESKVDATNERLGSLESKVDVLNGKVEALNDNVGVLNDKVEVLNEKVEAIGRFAKNVSRRTDKAIDELRERVAKLEARRKN